MKFVNYRHPDIGNVHEPDLPHVVEKWVLVVSPVLWKIGGGWEFLTAKLQGDLKTVAAKVVEVLHSWYNNNHPLNYTNVPNWKFCY